MGAINSLFIFQQSWLNVNPKIVWFVFDESNNVIAYVYGLPLVQEAFARILQPQFDEKTILPQDILPYTTVCASGRIACPCGVNTNTWYHSRQGTIGGICARLLCALITNEQGYWCSFVSLVSHP